MFVIVLWLTLAGGIVMLLQRPAVGVVFLMFAIAVVAGSRSRPIRRFFESESRSSSLPARILLSNLLAFLLFALIATVYLDELPLYMMDPDSQRVLIFAGIAAILAAGALITSLIALRRDRAERASQ